MDAGHAWWKLTAEAPIEAVSMYASTNCARWLNVETGYGPVESSFDFWRLFLLQGIDKQGPGKVYGASTGATVHRSYIAGFIEKGVIEGAMHVDKLATNPGIWDTAYHSCVDETIITGKHSGVQLPRGEGTPEDFGFKLPPDSN
jgi:hypothetical protein